MSLRSEDIVGFQVCSATRADVVNCVTDWLSDDMRECHYFACLNPHAVEIASTDATFHKSLVSADFLTPDGIGIIYASRILGGQLERRLTGTDVFLSVSAAMQQKRLGSCFFLGSTEETLKKIKTQMASSFPSIEVSGTYSPPFKPEFSAEDNRIMIQAINDSNADVLWVGLTAPKQEKWIYENRKHLKVKFAAPIGAAFDFFVGNIARVGPVWQDLGFEWLPRLIQEPRRLWRRSLISAPLFLLRTIRYRVNNKPRLRGSAD